MTEQHHDKLLANAGGLLMAAGFLAAFTGGLDGLSAQNPGIVVLSVLLLIGYGVTGYLLRNRGADYYHFALPAAAVLVVATLFVLRADLNGFVADEFGGPFLLFPLLTLILSFAGGALLTHAVEEATHRVVWPGKSPAMLNTMLHVAAYAPIWNAFVLLNMLGSPPVLQRVVIVGASVAVAVACVVGGYAAARHSHPKFTLIGAGVGFVASVMYLFQFMLGRWNPEAAFFGQFNALLGLILTGFPIAIAAVAWIQVANGERGTVETPAEPASQP